MLENRKKPENIKYFLEQTFPSWASWAIALPFPSSLYILFLSYHPFFWLCCVILMYKIRSGMGYRVVTTAIVQDIHGGLLGNKESVEKWETCELALASLNFDDDRNCRRRSKFAKCLSISSSLLFFPMHAFVPTLILLYYLRIIIYFSLGFCRDPLQSYVTKGIGSWTRRQQRVSVKRKK